jgi:uncharacterized protein (TIGR04551 family)
MRVISSVAAALSPLLALPALAFAQGEPPRPPAPPAAAGSATPASSAAPPVTAAPATSAPATATPAATAARPPLVPSTGVLAPGAVLAPAPRTDAAASPADARSQGKKGEVAASPSEVFAEDWWHLARPVVELHGYFRTRAELFHNFALGRIDPPGNALWPHPPDHYYTDWSNGQTNEHRVKLCGELPASTGPCEQKTQAGANLRFRLNPEIHISDNLRILSQIDMLDNLVMGSTPDGWANEPSSAGGYWRTSRSGYTPLSGFYSTMVPPTAGQNSYKNSVEVKRVWGEYMTPIGQLRFGRMPSHWGLGMFVNSGDTYDSDYQSTADRIMFLTGIKAIDLYFGGAWDFAAEGASSASLNDQQGQPYDLSQLDDVSQYTLVLVRRRNPALQRLELARGNLVLNGGMYFVYRNQFLANDSATSPTGQNLGSDSDALRQGYVRRNARAAIPDWWLQLLYKKFRFEAEVVTVQGSLESTTFTGDSSDYKNLNDPTKNGWSIRQWGLATQTELKAVEDKLRMNFGFGWASGDPDVVGPKVGGLTPGFSGLQPQRTNNRTISTFRFHPDYRVDLILWRHILNRVQGSYYFRPSVDYDFSRNPNGQRFGGGLAVIWSRASQFVQAPGHRRDLGVEIDLSLYFQSKDGSLNDDPDKMGGFFTMLQYGVLFPLPGLDYMPGEKVDAEKQNLRLETSAAQTLRWYMGILF